MSRPRTTSNTILRQLATGPKLLSELCTATGASAAAIRTAISRLRDEHYEIITTTHSNGCMYEWLQFGKRS